MCPTQRTHVVADGSSAAKAPSPTRPSTGLQSRRRTTPLVRPTLRPDSRGESSRHPMFIDGQSVLLLKQSQQRASTPSHDESLRAVLPTSRRHSEDAKSSASRPGSSCGGEKELSTSVGKVMFYLPASSYSDGDGDSRGSEAGCGTKQPVDTDYELEARAPRIWSSARDIGVSGSGFDKLRSSTGSGVGRSAQSETGVGGCNSRRGSVLQTPKRRSEDNASRMYSTTRSLKENGRTRHTSPNFDIDNIRYAMMHGTIRV